MWIAPAAQADYSVDRFIGEGQFNNPAGVAVDENTGQIYMTDGPNVKTRVVRLGADGKFEVAWGRGVLTGGTDAEICTASQVPCGFGSRGNAEGAFSNAWSLALNSDTRRLYVADGGLNARVQEFSVEDNGTPGDPSDDLPLFVRTWGWGVDDGSAEFQICTSACGGGLGGGFREKSDGIGQLSGNLRDVAVSPVDGDIFVADSGNRRVSRFNSDGTPDATPVIGSAARFGSFMPGAIAVDSQGILYVADRESDGEIERYDASGVHGAEGFMSPIAAPPLLAGTAQVTTGGLAVQRDPDGAGPEVDRLFVYRMPNSGTDESAQTAVVQQLDSPGEPTPPGTDAGPHAEGVFETEPGRGIAYNPTSDRLYVAIGTTGSNGVTGGEAGPGLYILDADGTPEEVHAGPPSASEVGPHSVELSATVDPVEGRARYWFEHRKAGEETWQATPLRAVDGAGPQPVAEEVGGLEANSTYEVRLQARKVLGPNDLIADSSAAVAIQTVAIPPTVTTGPTHSFSDASAWLTAEINPEGSATTYFFEYGTDTSYGSSTPQASAGGAGTPSTFLSHVEGLQPDTTYHYRVVTSNPEGTSLGEDRSLTTRPAHRFADRAYEQVSPVQKFDLDIAQTFTWEGGPADARPVSADGDATTFKAQQALGDQDWGGHASSGDYLARRTASGWVTESLRPRPANTFQLSYWAAILSWPNLSRVLLNSFEPLTDPPQEGTLHFYESGSGAIETIGVSDFPAPVPIASAELGSVVFDHTDVLAAGAPAGVFKAYEYRGGAIRLVSLQPASGAPFGTAARIAGGANSKLLSAVSPDGSHVFFETPSGQNAPTELYRRTNGVETVHVSPSQRSPADPEGAKAKAFLGASADGGTVFFSSAELLTDEANTGPSREGSELYRYEIGSDELRAISAETNTAAGARVQGVLGFSDDGKVVYYVALGEVVAGEATPGKRNVYRWEDDGSAEGQTRFVATLADSSACDGWMRPQDACAYSTDEPQRTARVSADGRVAAFQSSAAPTGYRNNAHNQVYIYEADAHGGQGALSCASCRPDGSPAQGAARLPRSGPLAGNRLAALLSSDGRRLFFNSADRLLAGDENDKVDVYLWEAGELRLISTGKGPSDQTFSGADPAGESAFFVTREHLVGQDGDELLDLYVARIGGGIAAQWPSSPGEGCVGEECKGAPAAAPPALAPATPYFSGPGNPVQARSCRPAARRANRVARRAKRSLRQAKRTARSRVSPVQARRAKRRAVELRRRAVKLGRKARRCRAQSRGASR
ncbi:MAG: hypothetical protein WDZ46_09175 [Solirubrobacterales bacterium]